MTVKASTALILAILIKTLLGRKVFRMSVSLDILEIATVT